MTEHLQDICKTGAELLVRALIRRRIIGLRRQNRDAEFLTCFDVIRIAQVGVELLNLPQDLRRAIAKLFCADTQQGLPGSHIYQVR
jgi:hypothetical protein